MAELKILYPGSINSQFPNGDQKLTIEHEESYYSALTDERDGLIEADLCERGTSTPRTAPLRLHQWGTDEEVHICHDEEFETAFTSKDDVHGSIEVPNSDHSSSFSDLEEPVPDLSALSDDGFSTEPEKSADYGFICAVVFLVTGISLVVISYTVPRDVKVNPDSVSAREMERLVRENARVGAHLDRCVIAGLCLLTLGGVVLSILLTISLYKGEMARRKAFAYSKHSTKLYGSINFTSGVPSHLSLDLDDTMEISS